MPPTKTKPPTTIIFKNGLVNPLSLMKSIISDEVNLLTELDYLNRQFMYNNDDCLFCDYHGCNGTKLRKHYASKHPDKQTSCDKCSKICQAKPFYYHHLIEYHILYPNDTDGDIIGNCYLCEANGTSSHHKSRNSLTKHYKKHYKKETFICNICNKPMSTASNLKTHMETHKKHEDRVLHHCFLENDKTHPCTSFSPSTTASELARHHLKAHGILTEGRTLLECDVCGFLDYDKTKFNHHIKTHDNNQIYPKKCTITPDKCGIYKDRFELTAHKSHKHDKGTKICDNCGTPHFTVYPYNKTRLCRQCLHKNTGYYSNGEQNVSQSLDKIPLLQSNMVDTNTFSVKFDIPLQYMPDKLYMTNDLLVLFECDEHSYPQGAYNTEEERLSYFLPKFSDKNIVVVRYNPGRYEISDGESRYSQKNRLLLTSQIMTKIFTSTQNHSVSLYYLFYNTKSEFVTFEYPYVFVNTFDKVSTTFPMKKFKLKIKKKSATK